MNLQDVICVYLKHFKLNQCSGVKSPTVICFVSEDQQESEDAINIPYTKQTHDFAPMTSCRRVMKMNKISRDFIFCVPIKLSFLIAFLKGSKSDLNA